MRFEMSEQLDLFYDQDPVADPNIQVGDYVIPEVDLSSFGLYAGNPCIVQDIRVAQHIPKYNVGGLWFAKLEVSKL